MDFRRLVLYAILAFLGVTLWNKWTQEHPPAKPAAVAKASTPSGDPTAVANIPTSASSDAEYDSAPPTFNPAAMKNAHTTAAPTQKVTLKKTPTHRLVHVKTDVLDVTIDTKGGQLIQSQLPKYAASQNHKGVFVRLLTDDLNNFYVSQSGLTNISAPGRTNAQSVIQYKSAKTDYNLGADNDSVSVVLTGETATGLSVTKTFTFKRDRYAVDVQYCVKNNSGKAWSGSMYGQLSRRNNGTSASMLNPRSYVGTSYGTKDDQYVKMSFDKMKKHNLSQTTEGGWVAMQQHYFLSAWVPQQTTSNHLYTHTAHPARGDYEIYTTGFVSPAITVAPGKTGVVASTFYTGPEVAARLSKLAKGLDLTIDFGWLWMISKLIFWLLQQVFFLVHNWGWSIVIVTIVIKILFYPLSKSSFISMAKMRELQPRMTALKERFSDDKQALSRATMDLYKKEKVNPLGGCLPMLIQIPVFIALYYVLFESVELRQAPFILWINDLAVKDPFFILPILMGISMFLQQKLTPTPMDSAQAKMMMFLPVIFTVFFATFPSGLVLYWLVNNVMQIIHQTYVMKQYERNKAAYKATHK